MQQNTIQLFQVGRGDGGKCPTPLFMPAGVHGFPFVRICQFAQKLIKTTDPQLMELGMNKCYK